MSDLNGIERSELEKLLGMRDGYVLNFTDSTFRDFFIDHRVDVDDERYRARGASKAKRMRTFWELEPNPIVGRVLDKLIDHAIHGRRSNDIDASLVETCQKIARRLLGGQPVAELGALTAIADERDFEVVAQHVREAIEKNQPEGGLDRLHTFVNKFVRVMSQRHGIKTGRDKPLHSVFGEYVKALKAGGHLESEMTHRILKNSISMLEAFNDVRNNKSLAHDNPILNHEESLLIFNQVAASIRFIKALEKKIQVP